MNEREQVLKFLYETATNTNMPIEARLKASAIYLSYTCFPLDDHLDDSTTHLPWRYQDTTRIYP